MRAGQAVRPPGPQPGRSSNCSSFISPVGQVRIVLRRALWFNSKKQPWRRISHLPSFAQTGSEIKDTSLGEGGPLRVLDVLRRVRGAGVPPVGPAGFQPADFCSGVYLSRRSGTKADGRGYQGAAPSKPPTLIKRGSGDRRSLVFRQDAGRSEQDARAPVCFASAIDRVTDITLSPA
jgi:hypothetical protein